MMSQGNKRAADEEVGPFDHWSPGLPHAGGDTRAQQCGAFVGDGSSGVRGAAYETYFYYSGRDTIGERQ